MCSVSVNSVRWVLLFEENNWVCSARPAASPDSVLSHSLCGLRHPFRVEAELLARAVSGLRPCQVQELSVRGFVLSHFSVCSAAVFIGWGLRRTDSIYTLYVFFNTAHSLLCFIPVPEEYPFTLGYSRGKKIRLFL